MTSPSTSANPALPVDCIHRKKNTAYDDGRPAFDEVSQLYIDLMECIDCGARVPSARCQPFLPTCLKSGSKLTEINASYVQGGKFTPDEFAKHPTK
jgi:hypothetical protein